MPSVLPSTATVGTNTSSLWPDIQKGLARLREVEKAEDEEDLVMRKSEVIVPSWSSPVLGDSVSMYEEEVAELFHNILGQV